MREKKTDLIERTGRIIDRLKKEYPGSKTALDFKDPLQCLIATILSAQCTDIQVNKVTPQLFKKYPTAKTFSEAKFENLAEDIHSTGFFNNKARLIINCCRALLDKFNGKVPNAMDDLLLLDGVGRKTANCVLGNAYGQPAITVDTHLRRLSQRMGLTRNRDPDKIEFDLQKLIPAEDWLIASHIIIDHGRKICKAQKPLCGACPIADLCPKIDITESIPRQRKQKGRS